MAVEKASFNSTSGITIRLHAKVSTDSRALFATGMRWWTATAVAAAAAAAAAAVAAASPSIDVLSSRRLLARISKAKPHASTRCAVAEVRARARVHSNHES